LAHSTGGDLGTYLPDIGVSQIKTFTNVDTRVGGTEVNR